MAISKIILNGVTQMDVTGKTVTSASMRNGITALKNDGTDVTGNIPDMTLPSAASSTSSGTAKATITPTSSAQYLNIPEGYNDTAQFYTIAAASGGSSWTKVAETSYQIEESTSTTDTLIGTIQTGRADLWTSAKMVYFRIRDTAGKREGYFYGTDYIMYNVRPINGETTTNNSSMSRTLITYYNSKYTTSNSAYGVYVSQLTSAGDIKINKRYSSSISRKIGGTYKVEVYLLDPPAGVTIFE